MPPQNPAKTPVPIWAWPFAVACFAIPIISLGGAIPAGLGVGGGFYCLAVAREANKSTYRKLFHCGTAMALAWTLFLMLSGGVALLKDKAPSLFDPGAKQGREERFASADGASDGASIEQTADSPGSNRIVTASAPSHPVESGSLDEATRRKIYAKAVSLRDDIERAEQREREFRAKGMGDVPKQQVTHIKGMHEKRQEFTADFYDITRAELDEIVAEGDRKHWPRG